MSNGNGSTPQSHTEAPTSATAKFRSPQGATWMITRRNESAGALLKEIEQIEKVLLSKGWEPVEEKGGKSRGKSNYVEAPTDGSAPLCPVHNAPMSVSQYGGYYCTKKTPDGEYCSYKSR